MLPGRNITSKINWILDNVCPPVIRDCRPLMHMLFRLAVGKEKAARLLDFKENFHKLSQEEFEAYYISDSAETERPTDLTTQSLRYILDEVSKATPPPPPGGDAKILDISCGRGFLSYELSRYGHVTGVDVFLAEGLVSSPRCQFAVGNIEKIDFPDNFFDIVVSTHTLEHVKNIEAAVSELRRVCKGRLIVVVPCQREYRYTFDLHVHFFPYPFDLLRLMNNPNGRCIKLKGDLIYTEEAQGRNT